jgi:hypothetical protein
MMNWKGLEKKQLWLIFHEKPIRTANMYSEYKSGTSQIKVTCFATLLYSLVKMKKNKAIEGKYQKPLRGEMDIEQVPQYTLSLRCHTKQLNSPYRAETFFRSSVTQLVKFPIFCGA